jgi:hypothetical protein
MFVEADLEGDNSPAALDGAADGQDAAQVRRCFAWVSNSGERQ